MRPAHVSHATAGESATIVVLTALAEERATVLAMLPKPETVVHPAGTRYDVAPLAPGWRLAVASVGEGNPAAAVLTERSIAMFDPVAVLFVGIAGALRDDVRLGDIVVAKRVFAFGAGRDEPDGFRVRPRSWEAAHELFQLALSVEADRSWVALLPLRERAHPPSVHFAAIAAGEVVLNNRFSAIATHLSQTYSEAVAIETEGAGFAQAGQLNRATAVLAIRGISDAAGGDKDLTDQAGWRLVAARHAAAFAVALARRLADEGSAAGSDSVPDRKRRAVARTASTVRRPQHRLCSRLRLALAGHTDRIYDVAVAPDGTWLATAGGDKTVRIWRADGTHRATLTGHTHWVVGVAVAPDGTWLASASGDGTVRLWWADGSRRVTLAGSGGWALHAGWVFALAIAPDGSWLASAGNDGLVRLWWADGTHRATLIGHTDTVLGVAISPDGTWLASTGWDRTVKLWLADGTPLATLAGHTDAVNAVAVAPDATWLASASADATVRLWSIDGRLMMTLAGHVGAVCAVAIAPLGGWLASASVDGSVRLWRSDGSHEATLRHAGAVRSVAIAPGGRWLATAGEDGMVRIWPVVGGGL